MGSAVNTMRKTITYDRMGIENVDDTVGEMSVHDAVELVIVIYTIVVESVDHKLAADIGIETMGVVNAASTMGVVSAVGTIGKMSDFDMVRARKMIEAINL